MNRRDVLKGMSAGALAMGLQPFSVGNAFAKTGTVPLSFPFDVESWDPTARIVPQATSLHKCVFDQPLNYGPDNNLNPGVVSDYAWLGEEGLALKLEFRKDVVFHNGDRLTSDDFKFTFFDRFQNDKSLQLAYIWNMVSGIETPDPYTAIVHLNKPFVTAPQYLGFAGSFVLPCNYFNRVGEKEFLAKPVGTGPYKLERYEPNNRIVLSAFKDYWGGAPALEDVTIQIMPSPNSRVSAIQSRQVSFAYGLPLRSARRLGDTPGFESSITPTINTYMIHMVNVTPLDDRNVRLAMHHAIDKKTINRALFYGESNTLNMPSPEGAPAHDPDFEFAYDVDKAKQYLADSGYGPDNPVRFKFFSTSGVYPSDYELARIIAQMWHKVGIEVQLQTIDLGKYFQAAAAGTLEGPVLWLWSNASGDPELYSGSYLNANTPFSVWRSDDVTQRLEPLLTELDYDKRIAAYQKFERWAVEEGYSLPLLQGVCSVAYQDDIDYKPYNNGWMLPAQWKEN